MENNSAPSKYKDKFGVLFSMLHEVGFRDEIITKAVLEHPFFSCFEEDKSEVFLKTSIETIIADVFRKKDAYLDYALPFVAEYYWAGQMYFVLLKKAAIPLERSLLIYPLNTMVERFNPYHEMHEDELIKRYLLDEERIGVFHSLKHLRNLSIRELSILTGIKETTLISYNKNKFLWNASFQKISLLADVFRVRMATFKKKSSFCILSYEMLQDEDFLKSFKKELLLYFGISKDLLLVNSYKDEKDIAALAKKHRCFFYTPTFALIKYQGRINYRFLSDEEIQMLVKRALD